jgi:hypothetical protein
MKRYLFFVLILVLYYLTGCFENSMNNSKNIPFKQIIYTTNPCEQDGIDHNIILDSMIAYFDADYDLTTINGSFIDSIYFDTLAVNYIVRAYVESGIDPYMTFEYYWNNIYDTAWVNNVKDGSLFISNYIENYQFSTANDSAFCMRMKDMFYSVWDYCWDNNKNHPDSVYTFLCDSIVAIENDMLADTTWSSNSNNEAWKRIAHIKYSVEFWYNYNHGIYFTKIQKNNSNKSLTVTEDEWGMIYTVTVICDEAGPLWSFIGFACALAVANWDKAYLERQSGSSGWWIFKW